MAKIVKLVPGQGFLVQDSKTGEQFSMYATQDEAEAACKDEPAKEPVKEPAKEPANDHK